MGCWINLKYKYIQFVSAKLAYCWLEQPVSWVHLTWSKLLSREKVAGGCGPSSCCRQWEKRWLLCLAATGRVQFMCSSKSAPRACVCHPRQHDLWPTLTLWPFTSVKKAEEKQAIWQPYVLCREAENDEVVRPGSSLNQGQRAKC